ncbi:MAG: hypothetical protein KUG77_20605 [Nannocystaceae bacterium]|nr:hypothetical protein [Nannocystaceae bacterium]
MEVQEETLALTVQPCFGSQSGTSTEGEMGFVAVSLGNQSGENPTMTCRGDEPNTCICEHEWLDGEFVVERLLQA